MGRLRLGLYSISHFLVDLGCALLILGRICPDWDPKAAILLYNLFAFAVQMPVGLLADRFGRCERFAAGGCLLVLIGWLLPPGLFAVIMAGLGNALFHVGGGLYTLNSSDRKTTALGVFVSPGAIGIYLGRVFAYTFPTVWIPVALAAVSLLLLLPGERMENAPLAFPKASLRLLSAASCLFLVVALRSLLGLAGEMPWKTAVSTPFGWVPGFAATCAVAFGKATGGYLADRFGMLRVAFLSLLLSAVCFSGSDHMIPGLLGLFLFNMTMPLTLRAAADLFPGLKGFSFGLLTLALFLGFLPVFFRGTNLGPMAMSAGALASLPLLMIGLALTCRGGRLLPVFQKSEKGA